MSPPFERWHEVIPTRRSWRLYDSSQGLTKEQEKALREACASFRPFPHARAVLVTESPETVFSGLIGGYGKVKGAPAFVAFIGDMTAPTVQEEVGYTGEGIVLEATALGLDTCWVAGFFRPGVAGNLAGATGSERVLAVTPVGSALKGNQFEERVMSSFGRHSRRRELSRMCTGVPQADWPEWVRAALNDARMAPSAVNRQPWGFRVETDAITVYVRGAGPEMGVSRRLDCGIAMLHLEIGAAVRGISGKWDWLSGKEVARFTASSGHGGVQ